MKKKEKYKVNSVVNVEILLFAQLVHCNFINQNFSAIYSLHGFSLKCFSNNFKTDMEL